MPYDLTIVKQHQLAGKSYVHQQTKTAGDVEGKEEPIPVAAAGTLTTRTDANTGTLTMDSADHGITTGDVIDIYWTDDDGVSGSRRGVNVGSVAGTSVPFDVGLGDNLPDADTVVQAAVVQVFATSFEGNDMTALVASADSTKATIVLKSTLTDDTALAFGTSSPATAFTLPANAIVSQVKVTVHTAFNGSAPTLSVGISGTVAKYMGTGDNDLKTVGVYTFEPGLQAKETTDSIILTYVADSSTVGAATVTIYYKVEELAIRLPLNGSYDWTDDDPAGATNPLAGDSIDEINMTIADTVTARNARVAALLDR